MKGILRVVFLTAFAFGCVGANSQYPWMIYTYAGGNISGDYIPATSAFLNRPNGLATDAAGNLYIADAANGRVRKIDSSGTISTVAGTGYGSTTGTLAVQSLLSNPTGITFDVAGNLYICCNNYVFKVTKATGIIAVFAGSYNAYSSFSGDGGPATSANLGLYNTVAVDSLGNVYIADGGNNRLRKVDAAGIITTIAGNGTATFNGDNLQATATSLSVHSIAFDKSGNILIADRANARIRKMNIGTGIITTVAGTGSSGFSGDGGQAIAAKLDYPIAIKTDKNGNIYFIDVNNNRIRKINTAGVITTVAGNGISGFLGDGGLATASQLATVQGILVDSAGNIYLSEYDSDKIRRIDKNGIINTIAGNGTNSYYSGEGQSANLSQFNRPNSVSIDSKGNMYIADIYNVRIRKIDPSGIITSFAGTGYIYGGYTGNGGPATLAQLNNPMGATVDAQGNVYIADAQNEVIRKVNTLGIISTVAGSGVAGYAGDNGPAISAKLNAPNAVALDAAGNMYIADFNNNCIRKVDTSGIITTIAGNGTAGASGDKSAATAAKLNAPKGVFVDAANNIYIADCYNGLIRKINTSGIINTVAGGGKNSPGTGGLATAANVVNPTGVAVDKLGNIYFSDGFDFIKKVDTSGILSIIGGTSDDGTTNFGGDGGGISSRQHLFDPQGIALDSLGNVYIADYFNYRIRKLCLSPSLTFTSAVDTIRVSTVTDINNNIVFYEGCKEIASLVPNGGNPVLGHIAAKVWVDSTQQGLSLKRHYQITPSENASTATAKVTLYYTQSDFDDYNAVNTVKLPRSNIDAAGRSNFKIEKRSGVSIDGTGSPASYAGAAVIIDPNDNDVIWNGIYNRWEVSFNVTGFSGFFAKAIAVVLPVQWLLINGQLNNSQFAEINWQVQEQNVAKYEVQKSNDGINFQVIGMLASVGNGLHNYHFTENLPLNGKAIYRIKQTDIDSRIDFSKAVYLGTDGKTMLYPNPAKATTTLFSSAEMLGSQAFLYSLQGKMLQQITIQQNAQAIDLSHFTSGVYMLKLANGQTIKLLKE